MRLSETVGLTWADIDGEAREIRINKSRHLGQDNDHPKTTHSGRTIKVSRALMDLILSLRYPWSKPTDKVFLNKHGEPIKPENFRIDYWDRILHALRIRKRKFYTTRHTLITHMVRYGKDKHGQPLKLKEIADYCGTSVSMIEQHYTPKSELDPDMLNDNNTAISESLTAAVRAAVAEELAGHEPVDTGVNVKNDFEKEGSREVFGKLVAKVLEYLASPTCSQAIIINSQFFLFLTIFSQQR